MLVGVLAMNALVVLHPTPASAACTTRFLTFPAWYDGLTDKDCSIEKPDASKDGLSKFIWKIVLNVIEILMQLVAYASVAFLIWGGFTYMTAAGSADMITNGKKTIFNAIIGLVISIMAVAIVTLIGRNL